MFNQHFSADDCKCKKWKKMCTKFTSKGTSATIGYTYPVLHQGKKWIVDFFAMDPYQNKMRRKKYMIADDLKRNEKKRRTAEIIEAVTSI